MKRKLFKKKKPERVAVAKKLTAKKKKKKLPVINLIAALLIWLLLDVFFYSGRLLRPQQLMLGQRAPDTIIASVDFQAETIAATELKKREAAKQVLPVFNIDTSALNLADQALTKLIPRLQILKDNETTEQDPTVINDLLDVLAVPLTADELLQIVPAGNGDLQPIIFDAISDVIRKGIVSESDLITRFNSIASSGQVSVKEADRETIRDLNSFITQPTALKNTVEAIGSRIPKENRDETVIRTLVSPWLRPNVIYDAATSAKRTAEAMEIIDPVIEPVASGTILVRSGDLVNEQTLRWLTAHEKRLSELETTAERIQRLTGSSLVLLIGLILSAGVAGITRPDLLNSRKQVLLLLTISVLPLTLGKLLLTLTVGLHLLPPSSLDFILPLGMAPLLGSILLGGVPGLIVGVWTSFALSALSGGSFSLLTLGLMTTLTAIYTTRDVKRRSSLFRAGLWIGAVKIIFALLMAILHQPSWKVLVPQIGLALVSGFTVALLSMLLIPLFEHLFKVTTDITLLELSDLSHPLLQSLAMNAPGTYHHSLMMASLAQNAAESIGANGLMLRVCAYFHDVGKLVKPGFFSENIQYTANPHDELSPSMSTIVIVSHIKEGVMLARKHKLPEVVIDGIRQHQGTCLVSVFYHRAKVQQEEESGRAINDEDFRYEGPRPQNREMAILMLADGCEAASRSIDKPTPARISGMIDDIFEARMRDGQLNECNLTLAEISTLKSSFVFSLTNMLHGRVAYPKDENNRKKQPEETPAEPAGDSKTDS